MGKSILLGVLSGTVVATLFLGGVSLMLPPPGVAAAANSNVPAVAAEAPTAVAAAEVPKVEAPVADVPKPEAPVAEAPMPEAPKPEAPKPEPTPEAAVVEVPAGTEFTKPKTEEPAVLPGAEPVAPPAVTPTVSAPAAEPAPALAEVAPAAAPSATDTAPAAPAAPDAAVTTAEKLEPSPANVTGAAVPEMAPAASAAETAPAADVTASATPPQPAPAAEPVTTAEAAPVAEKAPEPAPVMPAAVEPAPVDPAPAEVKTTDKAADAEKANLPPVITFDAPEPPKGVAEAPKPGFRNVAGVKVNRLPTIGAPPASDASATDVPVVDIGDVPAVKKFAAPFENPDKLPMMAIVLIDIGEEAGGLDIASIRTLGIPLTVAIDPARKDAAARAAKFRDAGFEVAILDDSSDGATPSDVEVAYQGAHNTLPEAVAVMAPAAGGFQKSRQEAQHMVALVNPDGLAVISWDEGLNSVPQLAGDISLPHAEIWRAADGDGARSEAIRRNLDRAAFEAAQKGQIVVAMDSLPESVTALFAWVAEGGKGVALAPASAIALKAVGK